jgi:hypothetical protein
MKWVQVLLGRNPYERNGQFMDFRKTNNISIVFGIISIILPFFLIAAMLMTSMMGLTLLGILGEKSIALDILNYSFVAFLVFCVFFTISGIVIGIKSLKNKKHSIFCIVSSSISTILLLFEFWVIYYAGSNL